MTQQAELKLPRVAARTLEGIANGYSVSAMSKALGGEALPLATLRYYMRVAYRGLRIGPCYGGRGMTYGNPAGLAVGICLAAGLLQAKDLQRPGENFAFTMTPQPPENPIRYVDTHDRQGAPHVWPDQPLCNMKIPRGLPPDQPEAMELGSEMRTFLAATLLGMSVEAITGKGLFYYSKSTVDRQRRLAGFGTNIQFAAHCAAQNLIQVPEEVLDPTATVEPISYKSSTLLTLPPGAVYDGSALPPSSAMIVEAPIHPPRPDSV